MGDYRFFLGGYDLEMLEIRKLLQEAGLGDQVVDRHLEWGARASAYGAEISASLRSGETPVLIELLDDLPPDIDRIRLLEVDHHGARSGAQVPSALRQVYDLIGMRDRLPWTRHHELVAANDVGYVPALRTLGATPDEIRSIRDADRRAQGVTQQIESEARAAVADADQCGSLTLVRTTISKTSAITDFLLPEYGGPGPDNLLVLSPQEMTFFGSGAVIELLKNEAQCWYGGALPERGFWGAPRTTINPDDLVAKIKEYLCTAGGRRIATNKAAVRKWIVAS
jgi:hypothetical protein